MTTATPADADFNAFAAGLRAGRPQVIVRRIIDDLETPVSAYLKLGLHRPYACLLESVEGGAVNGRYSILTLDPDVVWRCRANVAELARGPAIAQGAFTPESQPALQSLRALIAASRFDLPDDLPPMAAGLFGVFGYDMVRLLEPLGAPNPDPLDLPDAVLTRPSLVAIFDSVRHEIVLISAAYPDAGLDAEPAHDAAVGRLDAFEAALRDPLPVRAAPQETQAPAFASPVDEAGFGEMVARAKDYIAAGDIFQVVLSHRFSAPWSADPFAFYRSLRRQNPSPYLFYLNFDGFQLAGSSPEILVRLKDGEVTIRPLAGTRARGETPEADKALEVELLADPKERAEHLMLLDLGRNDVGRVAAPGTVEVTESFVVERYSQVMHIVSNVRGKADPSVWTPSTPCWRPCPPAPCRARPRFAPWRSSTSWRAKSAASAMAGALAISRLGARRTSASPCAPPCSRTIASSSRRGPAWSPTAIRPPNTPKPSTRPARRCGRPRKPGAFVPATASGSASSSDPRTGRQARR